MTDWLHVIDLSFLRDAEPMDPIEMRNLAERVASVIEQSDAYTTFNDEDNVESSIEAIRACRTDDEFDAEMDWIYDWGDQRHIWIETQDPEVFKRHARQSLTWALLPEVDHAR